MTTIPTPIFKNVPNQQAQTTTGASVWLSRSAAVVAEVLIFDGEEMNDKFPNPLVLIVKRGPASLGEAGKWCFPCGYLDWNETAGDASVRETFEEAGVNIYGLRNHEEIIKSQVEKYAKSPWYVDSSPDHFRQNVSLHHAFIFQSRVKDFTPRSNTQHAEVGEIDSIKWARASDILEGKYTMAFDHDKVLQKLIEKIWKDSDHSMSEIE